MDDQETSNSAWPLRDARKQNALVKELRNLTNQEALGRIRVLMAEDEAGSLRIAMRALRGREPVEILLREAMANANASTIRSWLSAALGRIGARRTLNIVEESLDLNSDAVGGALYWLPSLLSDAADLDRVSEMQSHMFKPRSSDDTP